MIPAQRCHCPVHLLVIVDAESLVLGHAGQLDVLLIELLLHDLLQCLQDQSLGLAEGQRAVVFILQLSLGAFTAGANSLGVVTVESTRGFSVISSEAIISVGRVECPISCTYS